VLVHCLIFINIVLLRCIICQLITSILSRTFNLESRSIHSLHLEQQQKVLQSFDKFNKFSHLNKDFFSLRFMSNSQLENSIFSNQSLLSNESIQIAKQLKALFEIDLHKRRIKSEIREILEIISHLYSEDSVSFFDTTIKEKIRTIKIAFANSQQNSFFFEWVISSSLIITAVKALLIKIRDFRDFLVNFERASITIENTSSSAEIAYSESVISKEKISISFFAIFYEIISDLKSENSKFFELFTSLQRIDEKALSTQITSIVERIFSKTRTSDRLIERASERAQTRFHFVRVRSKKNSHFTHLRHLFTTQFFHLFIFTSVKLSSLQISKKSFVNLIAKKIFSKEYFHNASSIVFRYQSLQSFVQRNINLDFLKSIFSNTIRSRSQAITKRIIESTSRFTSQDFRISTESQEISLSLESNEKDILQEKITIESDFNHFSIQFTTSFKKQ
jgi:hypothetical protein